MKILAIHYSQTGQLSRIIEQIITPIKEKFSVEEIRFNDEGFYSFPWKKKKFFDAMPETVLMKKMKISQIKFQEEKYDLIILGLQPWFLSLSRPCSSLLQDEEFKKVSCGSKIITVFGARNMWINAYIDAKKLLEENKCEIIGNIPLYDRNPNLISGITIQYWVFTGKKDRKWGIFPNPGISEKDISFSKKYGEIICNSLNKNELKNLQKEILSHNKIDIPWNIIFIEERGKKMFILWAKLIYNKGNNNFKRNLLLYLYRIYLYVALFLISPIIISIYAVFFRIFYIKAENRKKNVILQL